MNIDERKQALEGILRQKVEQLQSLEAQRNSMTTEIVKIQGKMELLNELKHESTTKPLEQKEGEKE